MQAVVQYYFLESIVVDTFIPPLKVIILDLSWLEIKLHKEHFQTI